MPLLDRQLLKKTGIIGIASGELIIFVGGGYWVGSWLDGLMNSGPFFMAALALIGFIFSGLRIWRLAKSWMK